MKTKTHDRIKELRSALGLSQTEFAYQSGISHSLLTKLEAGDNPPTNKVLSKIIDKWNVDREWLVSGKGTMSLNPAKDQSEGWKDEAWTLAKEQIEKKDQTIDRLSIAFDRLTDMMSRMEVNFLHAVKETA